ncbi:uncharacterized protein LOC134824054 isoform X2 [Bolinopsis microptera]|uniref:uncharacterized protein LOC134824054 isoform X2 n=1 Tax=Bolinopsis microptera TaxID=2820187 RepID=UPI00307A4E80
MVVDVAPLSSLEKEKFLKRLPSHFTFCLTLDDERGALERLTLILHSVPPAFSAPMYNMLGYISYLNEEYENAIQYFDVSSSLDKDNLVGIANQIHLLRRLEKFEAANITLESVMAATASLPRHRERQKIGRSIADIAWAHSFLGLNCVADRLFSTSQIYEPDHEFTALGAALVQYNFSKHIDRIAERYYLTESSEKLHSIIQKKPEFNLPKVYLARLLNRRDANQRDGMDPKAKKLLNEALKRSDPFTDYMVAKEKEKYDDYDGSEGCIHLFNRSIKKHPTSFAYLHLAQSKKCKLFKGRSLDESAEIEKIINKLAEEREPPEPVKKSDSSRGDRYSKHDKNPPKPPTPPPPPTSEQINEEILAELAEITRYLENALILNPNQQRCFLELANVSILRNSKDAAFAYLKQAAEDSKDCSVKARAYRNLSYFHLIDGDVPQANTFMEQAFKYGISTLCKSEEKAKLVGFICTLLENLLNTGQVSESKQWVEYLVSVEHPEAPEFKARYKQLKGTGSKAGGLKVSTAISRTRKPQRTTQITKTSITGDKRG